jgi:hypothetical protein
MADSLVVEQKTHRIPVHPKQQIIGLEGLTGATGNIYCGLHEFEDMAFLLHFLRPRDLSADKATLGLSRSKKFLAQHRTQYFICEDEAFVKDRLNNARAV